MWKRLSIRLLMLSLIFASKNPFFSNVLDMQNSDDRDIDITIDSSSLQPFTEQEWRFNQQFMINTVITVDTLCEMIFQQW